MQTTVYLSLANFISYIRFVSLIPIRGRWIFWFKFSSLWQLGKTSLALNWVLPLNTKCFEKGWKRGTERLKTRFPMFPWFPLPIPWIEIKREDRFENPICTKPIFYSLGYSTTPIIIGIIYRNEISLNIVSFNSRVI